MSQKHKIQLPLVGEYVKQLREICTNRMILSSIKECSFGSIELEFTKIQELNFAEELKEAEIKEDRFLIKTLNDIAGSGFFKYEQVRAIKYEIKAGDKSHSLEFKI